ncbi:MAG TPA: hypothetical protein VFB59_01870 [Candidatus Saccharimonadales bacterium]|nr:hypothetical protein [Candidatus Saccharimonadales bacterium]
MEVAIQDLVTLNEQNAPLPAKGFASNYNQLGRPAEGLGAWVGTLLAQSDIQSCDFLGVMETFPDAADPSMGDEEQELATFYDAAVSRAFQSSDNNGGNA